MQESLFTTFKTQISNIELPCNFTFPFNYEPHLLAEIAAQELQEHLLSQNDWQHDFGIQERVNKSNVGKMFGVLVVKNQNDQLGYLSAFSGKLAGKNQLPHFVPPIFDLQKEGSFFRVGEDELSLINETIKNLEEAPEYIQIKEKLFNQKSNAESQLKSFRQEMKLAKKVRKQKRQDAQAHLSEEQFEILKEELKNESLKHQYDYKVLNKNLNDELHLIEVELEKFENEIDTLKSKRKEKSADLQQQLFNQYQFLNIKGQKLSVAEIFKNTPQKVPPAGAGECAAPKLLQYAFKNQLQPICMCEFWWGQSPSSEIRKHKYYYPSCKSKCKPILGHMLEGVELDINPLLLIPKHTEDLEVIYDDDDIVVVNKPENLLSVPGKTENDCVANRIIKMYPTITGPVIIHRLDMSTSGLLIIAKNKDAHEHIQKQFLDRSIKKRYVALLDGVIEQSRGYIKLPLRVDLDNRPHQLVCYDHGKPAVTKWEIIGIEEDKTRIHFYPLTGRTHQLRVHASHSNGLNTPIIGDDLYGTRSKRLCLHAEYIKFKHPRTQKTITLQVDPNF
ncbi:RluA family pseudouridine synthase [Saccharicrinis aurantiacus]|uniref:RluA family pseudouridine synthase n=1 Tax=Saccharicrinis aurantiacus TaxID=1849719 RepID=UPI000838F1F9|nr:pseudouridine synthase [Saccharicrinis aurantiacus]